MASLVQSSSVRSGLWRRLAQLDFISSFFSWLFMLASRLAEPLMTLSVLYMIIEAGVPVVKSVMLHNLSIAILIASPEIMLPGSFVVASQAQAQGNSKAKLLFVMCWLFVALTVITLASLFVFHLDATAFSIVTCARCAAGVGYSILIRVITHSHIDEPDAQSVRPPVHPAHDEQIHHLMQQIEHLTTTVTHVQQTAMNSAQNTASPFALTPELVETLRALLARTTISEDAQPIQLALPDPAQGEQETNGANNYERVKAFRANNANATTREIADALGISTSTVNKWANKIRIETEQGEQEGA